MNKNDLDKYYNGVIHCFNSLSSTNDEAKRLLLSGAEHGTLVVADTQTTGRGRQGNSFYSPSRSGIYMSIILKPQKEKTDTLYTISAAVAVRRVLLRYADETPEIKWVNDIYIKRKKVCGILCEAVSNLQSEKMPSVICGIGVNLTKPECDFPDEIKEKAGYVTNRAICRELVVSEIANELLCVLKEKNSSVIDEYSRHSMLNGKKIFFSKNGTHKKGNVLGVDALGGLIVSLPDGEKEILRSGEVQLEKF